MVRRAAPFFFVFAWTLDGLDDVAAWRPLTCPASHSQPSAALANPRNLRHWEGPWRGASASIFRLRDDDCIANKRDNHVRHGNFPDLYSWPVAPAVVSISERIVLESPALLCVCACVQSGRAREAFQVSGTSPESADGWSSNVGVRTSTGLT